MLVPMPARARMTRITTVAMRPLGFLDWLVDGWVVGVAVGGVVVMVSVAVSVVVIVSFAVSFAIDAPAGAMGFGVPVLSWSIKILG